MDAYKRILQLEEELKYYTESALTVSMHKEECGCGEVDLNLRNCTQEDMVTIIMILAEKIAEDIGANDAYDILRDLVSRDASPYSKGVSDVF